MRSRSNSRSRRSRTISRWSRPRKPQRNPKPERDRGLGLVDERRVVELELVEGVAQEGVVGAVDREEPGEDHRLGVAVAPEVGRGRLALVGDGVTDARLAHVLDAGDEVADLADPESLAGHRLRADDADLEQLVRRPRRHHDDLLARVEVAVDHAHVGHDPAVGVVDGVEDHRARRGVRVTDGVRDLPDDRVEQRLDADAGLAGDLEAVLGLAADEVGELLGVLLGLRRRKVDLVEDRDDGEVVLHRQVEVGEGLRLDPLGRVDEQHRALGGGERARHLVGEVDVPGGVDHVEDVVARACRRHRRSPTASARLGS